MCTANVAHTNQMNMAVLYLDVLFVCQLQLGGDTVQTMVIGLLYWMRFPG